MTHAYRNSSRNIYNYNNRNARFIPHRQFCLPKKGPRGAVIPPSASCRQRSGAYPSVLNILRACKREREKEREGRRRKKRGGEGTDPGRERRQKKNTCMQLPPVHIAEVRCPAGHKQEEQKKKTRPALRREGGEEGQGGRERAKKNETRKRRKENSRNSREKMKENLEKKGQK